MQTHHPDAELRDRLPFTGLSQDSLPAHGRVPGFYLRQVPRQRSDLAWRLGRVAKAGIDVVSAALLILFLMPVLLAIAVAVRLDGGPALFAHTRLGKGGQRFPCLKFRSMRTDSAAILQHVLATDPAAAVEWAATQKLRNDPRVTPVGAFLRKTSLDELPQLFNVLRREMSLVGPRPIVDEETRHYGDDIAYYYATRPGLTGLWQVSGRSGTTYEERVQLDTAYVREWTLWKDITILARTVPAVLKRTGAV